MDSKKEKNKLLLIIVILSLIIISSLTYLFISPNKGRVIMLYVAGSNLESGGGIATLDIEGINYLEVTKNNVKVVVLAGGTKVWKNNYFKEKDASIYELTEDGYKEVKSLGSINIGDYSTLSTYLNYVYKEYKASDYDLIFWNHGGAIQGAEVDDYTGDILSLSDISLALKSSPFNKFNKLENVIFRTCLNGTIEIANVFKNYAKYLTASEEITYGSGSGISTLEFINNINSRDSSSSVGKKFIENYKKTISYACNLNYNTGVDNYCLNIAYSVTDLSKIDKLNNSLNSLFKDINQNLNTNYNQVARVRANLTAYGGDDSNYYDMVDLYSLISNLEPSNSKAKNVLKNIKDSVIYYYTNNNYSNGLSIYFPYNAINLLSIYNNLDYSIEYKNFINKFTNLKNGIQISPFNLQNNSITSNIESSEKADLELELTDDQIKNYSKARYLLMVKTENGYTPLLESYDVELDGNKLKANVRGKQLRITDKNENDSAWLYLKDLGNNKYKTRIILENYHFDEWVSNILNLSNDFMVVDSNVTITKENDKEPYISAIEVNDYVSIDENKVVSGVHLNLSEYKYLFVLHYYYDIDENKGFESNTQTTYKTGLELDTNDYKFIEEDFDSNYEYYAVFQVFDVANNSYYSKLVKMN